MAFSNCSRWISRYAMCCFPLTNLSFNWTIYFSASVCSRNGMRRNCPVNISATLRGNTKPSAIWPFAIRPMVKFICSNATQTKLRWSGWTKRVCWSVTVKGLHGSNGAINRRIVWYPLASIIRFACGIRRRANASLWPNTMGRCIVRFFCREMMISLLLRVKRRHCMCLICAKWM